MARSFSCIARYLKIERSIEKSSGNYQYQQTKKVGFKLYNIVIMDYSPVDTLFEKTRGDESLRANTSCTKKRKGLQLTIRKHCDDEMCMKVNDENSQSII